MIATSTTSQMTGTGLFFGYVRGTWLKLITWKIQTHERFKRMLFTRTKTQSANKQISDLAFHLIFHCFSLFSRCLSVILQLDKRDYPENLQIVFLSWQIAFFWTFYVFGSCFIKLAVILVSDFWLHEGCTDGWNSRRLLSHLWFVDQCLLAMTVVLLP